MGDITFHLSYPNFNCEPLRFFAIISREVAWT